MSGGDGEDGVVYMSEEHSGDDYERVVMEGGCQILEQDRFLPIGMAVLPFGMRSKLQRISRVS
jgi:hypothetical protein